MILLGLNALLLLGILFEFGQRSTGDRRQLNDSSMTEVIALSTHEIQSERRQAWLGRP